MSKKEKLAELTTIRMILEKVTKNYCNTPEEREKVRTISMRLFQTQIIPLAEELTAQLVKDTKKLMKSASGVQLVDLGLPSGTLWADRNLGANAPEQYGDYFRWGETVPFTEESGEYQYRDFGDDIAGTEYDAATVTLGKEYRMPTFDQIKELIDHCDRKWTTLNNIKGMKVIGPNGNSIFIPAAGHRNYSSGTSISYVTSYGYCWSSSANSSTNARHLYLYGPSYFYWRNYSRALGFTVRPVLKN